MARRADCGVEYMTLPEAMSKEGFLVLQRNGITAKVHVSAKIAFPPLIGITFDKVPTTEDLAGNWNLVENLYR